MVPILEPSSDLAYEPAKNLGIAFQLANFIRDINEDLDSGRIYLPLEDLERFGVTKADLHARKLTNPIRDLIKFEISRVRQLEQKSRPASFRGAVSADPLCARAELFARHHCGGIHASSRGY